MTTTALPAPTASHPPASATPAQGLPIAWRTVAFATALIYGLGIPAVLALHHATATDPAPQVSTTCIYGDLINVSTGPDGRVTLTAPMDAPACITTAQEDK